ncbi:MAG: hypothetical protein DMF62_01830, partial [Acidobacteria bacterium]
MRKKKGFSDESGAALIAVIFISILLVTACAFLLSAVGHNSRNSTDVLAETKAYYAAESGLQAVINVFRNNQDADFKNNPYSYAATHPDLSAKLTYTAVGTDQQVLVGTNSGFKVNITDPDNAGNSTTYSVDGEFLQADGYSFATSRIFGTSPNTTTISYEPVASRVITHPNDDAAPFGRFSIVSTGTGAALSDLRFRINYRMTAPRAATRSILGTIAGSTRVVTINGTNLYTDDGNTSDIDFVFSLMGKNNIFLCQVNPCTTNDQFTLTLPAPTLVPQYAPSTPMYAKLLPIEPYRLKLKITGFARPGNAKKQLEAVIQRDLFNATSSSSAIAMVGPNAHFSTGTSAQMNIDGQSNASITVSDQASLATVLANHTNGTINPPPQIVGPDVPDWQQSTTAMDAFIRRLRQAAENSGRIFSGTNPANFGDFNSGTGITFCDGNCSMGGNTEGGGILVVTGTFSTSGNPKFNGLVL